MKLTMWLGACASTAALIIAGCGDDSDEDNGGSDEAAEDAGSDGDIAEGSAELVTPADGDEVSNPFEVRMATDDVEIAEGGMHFHLIVDAGCVDPGEPIPVTEEDERYRHYGDGSDEDEIELEPGDHELCLQVGDVAHIAQDITDEVSITVTD